MINYVYNGIFHFPINTLQYSIRGKGIDRLTGQLPAFCDHLALLAVWSTRLNSKTEVTRLGKRLRGHGKSPFLMAESTTRMAIFNSYVTNYQRVTISYI